VAQRGEAQQIAVDAAAFRNIVLNIAASHNCHIFRSIGPPLPDAIRAGDDHQQQMRVRNAVSGER
jgi:hypothetical protein